MEFITNLFPENILHALGWAVIHSLWQAFVVALLLSAYLLGWKKQSAQKRYIASYLALGTTLLLAIFTFLWLLSKVEVAPVAASGVATAGGELPGRFFIKDAPSAMAGCFNKHLPLIVTVWLLGMTIFILKMLGGLLYIQRLKHHRNHPLAEHWQHQMKNLGARLGIKKVVRLAESALVHTPMVAGWLKPVILIPVGAVNNLTMEQVEAILAHELAHIYRHDYLLNLLQSVIEFLLYFNPAVWWISANIRAERENCCDDLAVGLCGDSLTYARALVSLQEMRQVTPAFAMPFLRSKNQLLNRIKRILQSSPSKSNAMEKLSATLLLLAAILMLSVQANTPSGDLNDDFTAGVAKGEIPLAQAVSGTFATLPQAEADTVPKAKNKIWFHRQNDDGEVEIVVEDNKIVSLKIDGEEIPKERYGEYDELAAELLDEVENMPEAPLPPEPPLPPTPPRFVKPPAAPAPPTPAAPRKFKEKKSRKIITHRDGKNTTFIIETERDGAPVEIKIRDGKKSKIIINGKKLKKGKNKETIIVEEVEEESPDYFFFNDDGDFRFDGLSTPPLIIHAPRLHVLSPEEYALVVPKVEDAFPHLNGIFAFPDGEGYRFEWNEDTGTGKVLEGLKKSLEESKVEEDVIERYTEELAPKNRKSQAKEMDELRMQIERQRGSTREYNDQIRSKYKDQLHELREQQRQLGNQQRELMRQRRYEQKRAREEYLRALEHIQKQKAKRRLISNTAQ